MNPVYAGFAMTSSTDAALTHPAGKLYAVSICDTPSPTGDRRSRPRPILDSFVRIRPEDNGCFVVGVLMRQGDALRFIAPNTMTHGVFCSEWIADMAWIHEIFALYQTPAQALAISDYPSWICATVYRLQIDEAKATLWLTSIAASH